MTTVKAKALARWQVGPRAARALAHTVYVSPGSYQVQASWSEDRTDEETVTAVAADRVAVDLTAPPLEVADVPPPPPPTKTAAEEQPEEKRNGWPPQFFWTGLGATLVGVGVTTGLGIMPPTTTERRPCSRLRAARPDLWPLPARRRPVRRPATRSCGVPGWALAWFTIIAAIATDWGGKEVGKQADCNPSSGWSVRSGVLPLHPTMRLGFGFRIGGSGTFQFLETRNWKKLPNCWTSDGRTTVRRPLRARGGDASGGCGPRCIWRGSPA